MLLISYFADSKKIGIASVIRAHHALLVTARGSSLIAEAEKSQRAEIGAM